LGFKDAVSTGLRKYAVFQGRARRSEYWFFILFTVLVSIVAGLLDGIVFGGMETGPLGTVTSLALILPTIAVAARRLHDTDRSGWWQLIVFVPALLILGGMLPGLGVVFLWLGLLLELAAAVVLLVWLCTRGTPGPNRFGPDPVAVAG
jgi:uncharacterized membrane protein YhaH (DUF805 family)